MAWIILHCNWTLLDDLSLLLLLLVMMFLIFYWLIKKLFSRCLVELLLVCDMLKLRRSRLWSTFCYRYCIVIYVQIFYKLMLCMRLLIGLRWLWWLSFEILWRYFLALFPSAWWFLTVFWLIWFWCLYSLSILSLTQFIFILHRIQCYNIVEKIFTIFLFLLLVDHCHLLNGNVLNCYVLSVEIIIPPVCLRLSHALIHIVSPWICWEVSHVWHILVKIWLINFLEHLFTAAIRFLVVSSANTWPFKYFRIRLLVSVEFRFSHWVLLIYLFIVQIVLTFTL